MFEVGERDYFVGLDLFHKLYSVSLGLPIYIARLIEVEKTCVQDNISAFSSSKHGLSHPPGTLWNL